MAAMMKRKKGAMECLITTKLMMRNGYSNDIENSNELKVEIPMMMMMML
jgi:hypothetical protein